MLFVFFLYLSCFFEGGLDFVFCIVLYFFFIYYCYIVFNIGGGGGGDYGVIVYSGGIGVFVYK